MQDKVLVFIPAYNCSEQIGRVLDQFRGRIAPWVAQVLVLDNHSTDSTVEAATVAAGGLDSVDVVVARNRENYGLGGSHKAAYEYAEREAFTHVVTLHGDDQGSIDDLVPVLERGEHRRSDACMGARFQFGAHLAGYSRFRILGNVVFNAWFSIASRHLVTDMGSGLNLLGRRAFTDPIVVRHSDGLHFNPRLLLGMYDSGLRVSFFPISWREDDQVSNVKMASQAFDTFKVAWDYAMRRRRFRSEDHRVVKRASYPFDVLWASASVQ